MRKPRRAIFKLTACGVVTMTTPDNGVLWAIVIRYRSEIWPERLEWILVQ